MSNFIYPEDAIPMLEIAIEDGEEIARELMSRLGGVGRLSNAELRALIKQRMELHEWLREKRVKLSRLKDIEKVREERRASGWTPERVPVRRGWDGEPVESPQRRERYFQGPRP